MVDICPSCKKPVSWYEKRKTKHNTYVYAAHEIKENGKRKIRKCYLGPEKEYNYVSRMQKGLVLRGLIDENRELEYLEELIESLIEEELSIDKNKAKELVEKLEEFTRKLRKYAEGEGS